MGWWGKAVGGAFGFLMGGPLGALAGAAFGHQFDTGYERNQRATYRAENFNERERTQTAFFTTTFSVLGRLAKADGQVTPDEIRMASAVMDQMRLNPELKRAAQRLFNEGKRADFPLDEVLDQFRRECHSRHRLLRMFLEIQFEAAYADGLLHPAERNLLLHISERLGFSRREFDDLERVAKVGRQFRGGAFRGTRADASDLAIQDAYTLLQVDAKATDDDVKRAYRRMMSQHHPDKLVSKGLPEEMIRLATEKTQEIKAAYERIRSERGI